MHPDTDSSAARPDPAVLSRWLTVEHLLGPRHGYRVHDEAKFRQAITPEMAERIHRADHRAGFEIDGHVHEEPDGLGDGRSMEAKSV